MNAAIEKRTKRNSKLRDAIDPIGYGHKRIEGDQVERIIAEGIAGLAIALVLLMSTDALAQCRTSGSVSGGTSTGSSGTTTIYDAGGRSVGTVTTQQKREEQR